MVVNESPITNTQMRSGSKNTKKKWKKTRIKIYYSRTVLGLGQTLKKLKI